MRGVRTLATRAPGYGNFANFAQNPAEAAKLHFISQVAPKLAEGFNTGDSGVPFDSAYIHWGDGQVSPYWMSSNSGTNQDIGQWDATEKRLYRRLGNAGGLGQLGSLSTTNYRFFHPLGYLGQQTQFAPKNPNAQRVVFGSRLRFVDNVDYANYGWGCGMATGGGDYAGTNHSFNFTRSGAGKWRLYTMDGATRSSLDSTAADDGSWHDVTAVLAETALTLYVDNVAVISKTTNLPTRPIGPWVAGDNTHRLDIVDWRAYWEGD